MQSAETASRLKTVRTAPTCVCVTEQQLFLTIPDVALVLGTSREYLYEGIREGRFPRVNVGRSLRLPRSLIQGFVTEVIELGLSISLEDYAASWMAERAQAVAS